MTSNEKTSGNEKTAPSEKTDPETSPDEIACCTVNKALLPYKSHYFLLNGAHVGVIPYLPVFAKTTLGFSATTVGMLSTFMYISTTVSKPIFGLLADCFNKMKLFIAALLSIEVILNLSMLALPPIDMELMELPYQSGLASLEQGTNLRMAHAMIYNTTIILNSQRTDGFGQSASEYYYNFQLTNLNGSYSLNEVPPPIEKFNHKNYETFTCDLECNARTDSAICYQTARRCVDPSAESLLTCRLRKKRVNAFCDNHPRNPIFNSAFDVLNLINEEQSAPNGEPAAQNERQFKDNSRNLRARKNSFCNVTTSGCRLRCDQEITFCDEQDTNQERSHYDTYQFWVFCMLALVGSMCHGALFTLSDTACYEKLRNTNSDYGKQRFWAAIGWGVVAMITGVFNDISSQNSEREDYSPGWYVMACLSFFCLINLYFMDFPRMKKSTNMCSDVQKVMATRQFILMEINMFVLGVLNAYASNYVIWYMQSLGSTRVQMGLALTVSCLLGEAPFLYISQWMISKLGHWHCVTLIYASFGARFGAYFIIRNPWLILPVEMLHGLTFGLCYATMTSYAEKISPAGTEATIQGVLGGTYQGLGNGLGCLVAGISFDLYGGRRSFLLVAIFSVCMALSHYALFLICKPHKAEAEKASSEYQV